MARTYYVLASTDANRLNFVRQAGSRSGENCLSKGVYIEMMIDNLKVKATPLMAMMVNEKACVKDLALQGALYDLLLLS